MRNLIGLLAAAATFIADMEWETARCAARWRGGNLIAHYNVFAGCTVEVGYLTVPEGSISVPVSPLRIE